MEAQQEEMLRQQEDACLACEADGTGFYSWVTLLNVSAVKALYPEMNLTPGSTCAPSFAAKMNLNMQEGKISFNSLSDSPVLQGDEYLRSFACDPNPLLKVCCLVLVLVLVHVPVHVHVLVPVPVLVLVVYTHFMYPYLDTHAHTQILTVSG